MLRLPELAAQTKVLEVTADGKEARVHELDRVGVLVEPKPISLSLKAERVLGHLPARDEDVLSHHVALEEPGDHPPERQIARGGPRADVAEEPVQAQAVIVAKPGKLPLRPCRQRRAGWCRQR